MTDLSPVQDFGANEWIVEEMRDSWLADPQSVSPEWQAFFAAHAHPQASAQPTATTPATATAAGTQPLGVELPERKASGAAPHRQASVAQDMTRSDLPPAPAAGVAPPTSPYAARKESMLARDRAEKVLDCSTDFRLKGAAARTAKNMEESLSIPTATSVRQIPAKVLIENRAIINQHLAHTRGGKVSFTHLIGWTIVEALAEMPGMNVSYALDDAGKPTLHQPQHVGFGLAIDVPAANGERRLLVPSVSDADELDLVGFIAAYEELVRKARTGSLELSDFQGTTVTLTNPGMIGTQHSVPRLMTGQGVIIGVGAMDYPAAFAGTSTENLARHGVGKTVTLTSTYDHRVIQGAASGEFLRLIEHKLLGLDGFWDRNFTAMRIPHEPMRWERDTTYDPAMETDKPARVAQLIHAYRQRGHLAADTDPLTYRQRRHPDLSLGSYGLSVWDLDRRFPTGGLGGSDHATLREILERLREAYCRTAGIEYMHIQDPAQRRWWQERLECEWQETTSKERRRILTKLVQAEAFEVFLQTKYVGQKRFSLEGGESLIVLLDRLLDDAAHAGVSDVVIGMAHRGRLNVLTNIAGKSYGQVFNEFDGNGVIEGAGTGDVKYHLGTEGVFAGTDGASTHVALAANPSHLETVDGVVEGIVRARLDRMAQAGEIPHASGTAEVGQNAYPVMPVLVHGDSAFAGQGVVYETLNMSQLPAYKTGGTVHIIVNNQIGFTTGAASARSTTYATDLAKGLQVPIFHVNGDDPEAVVRAARWAQEYRQTFHKDVLIDLICYRRRGHNEGDDPSMTQPVMYRLIDSLPSTRAVYTKDLVGRGDITQEFAEMVDTAFNDELERIFAETKAAASAASAAGASGAGGAGAPGAGATGAGAAGPATPFAPMPAAGSNEREHLADLDTSRAGRTSAIAREVVERIGDAQVAFPEGFHIHPKLETMLAKRQEMTRAGGIDWGMGELLAVGSLLMEGVPVRLAGEDARRATFAQRHAVLHDHLNGQEWTPLDFLTPDQAPLEIYDSLLSEYAAMAFEYGYSVERPEALTMWEAQFGDFANGAQSVIDEYITSATQKWGQRSGLTLLLPHGQEGQGPDHSSARIERYLQMCAQENMWVVMPSTPANHFHMLRTQAFRRPRTPLIAFTPKQLLRLKAATSPLEDFASGAFQPVIGEVDPAITSGAGVNRVLVTSGRVYYDLLAERSKRGDTSTAIVRLEQLYPLPDAELAAALAPFAGAEICWVQDEAANQGVWPYLGLHLPQAMTAHGPVTLVSRPEAAAPAVGTTKTFRADQDALIAKAFAR